jgi:hypothetical protein
MSNDEPRTLAVILTDFHRVWMQMRAHVKRLNADALEFSTMPREVGPGWRQPDPRPCLHLAEADIRAATR